MVLMTANRGLSTERLAAKLARVRTLLHVYGGDVFPDAPDTGKRLVTYQTYRGLWGGDHVWGGGRFNSLDID